MTVTVGGGTLYLAATPIGNLEDITLRAIRVLKEVSLIACEDTRRTRGLLAHHEIRTPVISLHEHNERARIPQILKMLQDGKSVALVSDAGTPAVSDPGAALVAAAARAELPIVSVPGPSAVTAAVALADFPAGAFAFLGFPPRRPNERKRFLSALADLPMALVIFEAPHRIHETLSDIEEILGPRRAVMARELSKMHEEILRGTAAEIRAALATSPRGEVTLVIEGSTATGRETAVTPMLTPQAFIKRLRTEGLSRRDTARALAAAYHMRARDAYRLTTEGT
ncbi:MAG: 16S rRNA (cytidine(1402)-2'-O)-methyltransferase [bacterium]